MRIIRRNDTGDAVEDVQRRLRVLGYDVEADGAFLDRTQAAVRAFRESAGLAAGDVVDDETWSALVDASFSLGDRMLYLRMPYFHGGDVRMLQEILDILGFIVGGADGIFGAHTERAVREFQASVGLVDDGIAGATTFDAIARLKHAWEGKSPTVATDTEEHMGFARAAEVLEKIEACFYGLDELGRSVASRVANLAWATTAAARVTSADAMGGAPPRAMLKIGIATDGTASVAGTPVVEFSDDGSFAKRLATAVAATNADERVIVEMPAYDEKLGEMGADVRRWEQHLAVLLLDAFCTALR